MGQVVRTRKKPRRRTAFRSLGASARKVCVVVTRDEDRGVGFEPESSLAAGAITATAVVVALPLLAFSVDFFPPDAAVPLASDFLRQNAYRDGKNRTASQHQRTTNLCVNGSSGCLEVGSQS
jgi:hypothetical protein